MALTRFPPSLRHRQFNRLWISHIASVAGRRMLLTIALWHVSRLTDQPIALGIIGLMQVIPSLGLALVAGAVADIFNRRSILVATQMAMTVLCALFSVLVLMGQNSLWMIYVLVLLNASAMTIDTPARFSIVPSTVPREDLANASSLITTAFHAGNILGPGIVGILIARLGIGLTYLSNGLFFLIAVLVLLGMRPVGSQKKVNRDQGITVAGIAQGLRFVFNHPLILPSMLLDFFGTVFATATSLLPIIGTEILGVGAIGYGWLVAARSIGGAAVSVVLSFLPRIRRQGMLLFGALSMFGLSTLLLGFSDKYWFSFLALALIGASDSVSTVIRQTIRQLNTPDHIRGRMTSVNQIFFQGGPGLGDLRAGLTAQWIGTPAAVVSGGLLCLLSVAWIASRAPALRAYDGQEAEPAPTTVNDGG